MSRTSGSRRVVGIEMSRIQLFLSMSFFEHTADRIPIQMRRCNGISSHALCSATARSSWSVSSSRFLGVGVWVFTGSRGSARSAARISFSRSGAAPRVSSAQWVILAVSDG